MAFPLGGLPLALWPWSSKRISIALVRPHGELIIDSLCRIVERQQVPPELRKAVEQARVFLFEFNPHEALPKEYEPDVLAWLMENLYLKHSRRD